MQSKFSLISGRYLFHDDNLVATILDLKYARPLLYKLEQVELDDGTDLALKVLCYLATDGELGQRVRLPSPADHVAAKASLVGPQTRYGHKHTCVKCSQKFFDLNGKINRCPSCKTAIAKVD